MKKLLLLCLFFLMSLGQTLIGEDVVGIWKQIDDETGKPQSLVAIYEYQNKYYGRIIATYDSEGQKIQDTIYKPIKKAPGVIGHPFFSGLDFIWDLEKNGNRYLGGKILDPQAGKKYDAEMWLEDGHLMIRGEVLFIGKTQKWNPAEEKDFPPDFKEPDLSKMVPVIPQIENK